MNWKKLKKALIDALAIILFSCLVVALVVGFVYLIGVLLNSISVWLGIGLVVVMLVVVTWANYK